MAAFRVQIAIVGLLLLAGVTESANVSPIDKVYELMDELTAKVTAEGEAEAKAYEEFVDWCSDTAADTKFSIKTSTKKKEQLEATIAKATADAEAASTSIEELAAGIATAEADLKAATEMRTKEAAEFASVEQEMITGVSELEGAISKISAGSAAFLQQKLDSSNMKALLSTLDVIFTKASIATADKTKLMAMVQTHQAQKAAEGSDAELDHAVAMSGGAPEGASYSSHSSGITDLLADMKTKAEAELADARKAETTALHEFGMLKQGLEDEIAAKGHDMADAKTTKAEAEETTATASGDLTETTDELKKLEAYYETISTDCMKSAADHETSKKGRAEELAVIAEAKKIVQDAVGGAVSRTYSFLQVEVESKSQAHMELANMEVVAAVKRIAKQQHSAALTQLASRIAAVLRFGNKADIFAKIKSLITDMIAKLQKEAEEAASKKAYCDEENSKNGAKKEELDSDIAALTSKIDKASATSAQLKEEVATLQEELASLAKTTMESDKARTDEKAAYELASTELQAGIDGVQKALEVLRSYYGSASLIQTGDSKSQQPKLTTHSKSGGAGGSIISILEMCESDFSKDLAQQEMMESDAASEYEKVSQENKVLKATKEADVKYKTKEAKGLDKAVAENSGDREGLQTELSAVLQYQAKLDKTCISKAESYEERKAAREAEITGLKEALEILEGEGVLLQRPRHLRAVAAH